MSANTITHGRTLSVAASGTALVMAVFSAFVVNVGDSVRTFHAGVAGEAWGLSGWCRDSLVTGLGTGVVNAALGRIAVESVPHGRVGMGSGANNTARYLGGAAGAALIVSIASAGGAHGLIDGWNIAALVSAVLSAVGAAIVASCRPWRRRSTRPGRQLRRRGEYRPVVPTPWTPPTPSKSLIFETAGGEHPRST